MKTIGIIGSGAWGTALGQAARRAGRDVTLWARDAETVSSINTRHENARYLPGIPLDPQLYATTHIKQCAEAEAVLLVTPAQTIKETCQKIAPFITASAPVVLCAKGIEATTGQRLTEIIESLLPQNPIAVLSGPTFAHEVARGLPAAITLACKDAKVGENLVQTLGSSSFRPYYSDDVIGTEIGGAVKNVIAIACGIVEGRGLGANARAALLTRGLAEITRLAKTLGGKNETLMGLSGLGDTVLTCTTTQSRNMALGISIGQGKLIDELLKIRQGLAEGLSTSQAVMKMAHHFNLDMPICTAVYQIVYEKANLEQTITSVLSRPFGKEVH